MNENWKYFRVADGSIKGVDYDEDHKICITYRLVGNKFVKDISYECIPWMWEEVCIDEVLLEMI